jgi:uncharacterized protein DUF4402
MRFTLLSAAAAATIVTAAPAMAQQTGSASAQAYAKGTVVQPVSLVWQSDLDFGTVVSTATAGNVVIDADTGARTFPSGGPVGVPSYPGGRATFQGNGAVGQTVQISFTQPSVLVSTTTPTDLITVNSMNLDSAGATRVIGASGVFNVGVGGDFQIAANQAPGLYRAQFTVTAVYQ